MAAHRRPSPILPSEQLDTRILDYVLLITERARGWWTRMDTGTRLTRRNELMEYRLRMEGRRSVAELYRDVKIEPFEGAANIGIGVESFFAEFLIPLFLANTHDLEPKLQARIRGTKRIDDDLTLFHDHYHTFEVPEKREMLELSTREMLTVGGAFHKWTFGRWWRQADVELPVWANPLDGQPLLVMDQGTGRPLPLPADPKTPKDVWPTDGSTGLPMKIVSLKSIEHKLHREGPELSMRPAEAMTWPEGETRTDPDLWDWMSEDFEVSPYWLLGREGDPFLGKLKLKRLWKWLAIDPDQLHKDPMRIAASIRPIRLRAFHGKYPATANQSPVEITAMIAVDAKLNLGWRPSPFPRRPYFNRQVWHSGTSPLGKGIPETIYSLRSAMDALLNQEIDAGNLYNHPPLLLSDTAMLEDEDYETTGPGVTWIMRDIQGAKFLPTELRRRDPVGLLDWLITNTMRKWGVTDLTLNAPKGTLSPNVQTASGTAMILNRGDIKFGHLTRRISTVDSKEYQYVHESFRRMMANARIVSRGGEPFQLTPDKRQEYFSDSIEVIAIGNGISTNPIIRQQMIEQAMLVAVQTNNPFVIGDLEVWKDLTERWLSSRGIDLKLKDPAALQQAKIFMELMQTPEGQSILPKVLQQVAQQIDASQQEPPGISEGVRTNGQSALATR